MALFGRVLEPSWPEGEEDRGQPRPKLKYGKISIVAVDDIGKEDTRAGFLDEVLFGSAWYYKYFSIDWQTLLQNLDGFPENKEHLAAHTVCAFIRAAAMTAPTGKQTSFAAHNPPDAIPVELRSTPLSYADAFVNPVKPTDLDLVSRSIMQLVAYVKDIDNGYGKPAQRFWFSPNLRYRFTSDLRSEESDDVKSVAWLDNPVREVIRAINPMLDCHEVKKTFVKEESNL